MKQPVLIEAFIVCPNPPRVDRLILRPTPPTAEVIADTAVVIFSPKDYENLSKNLQDINTQAKQQNQVIRYYQKCIERNQKAPE